MFDWGCYVILVGLLLSGAAFAIERLMYLYQRPARWIWTVSMIASVLLPVIISTVSSPVPRIAVQTESAQEAPSATIPLRQMTSKVLSPEIWLNASVGETATAPDIDLFLRYLWLTSSSAMLLVILLSALQLHVSKRRWQRGAICGAPVYISEQAGPAVMGFFRHRIVVPRWLLSLPVEKQELVICHEQSHIKAFDAQLLLMALILLTCMPWNLPTWWQVKRLRRAIEIDCDARVVNKGFDVERYSEVLIAIGERQSTGLNMVVAMSESKSFLEYRIRHMLSKPRKFFWLSLTASACLALGLTSVAAQIRPPNADYDGVATHKNILLEPKALDQYVGYYHGLGDEVFSITRKDSQLSLQQFPFNSVPIYPTGPSTFFLEKLTMQIDFDADAHGQASKLIVHRLGYDFIFSRIDPGTAQHYDDELTRKFQSQKPDPRSEAVLIHVIDSIIAGKPDYAALSSVLVPIARIGLNQNPKLKQDIVAFRNVDVNTVKFFYVDRDGSDVYSFRQGNATWYWKIGLDTDGRIIALSPWVRRDR